MAEFKIGFQIGKKRVGIKDMLIISAVLSIIVSSINGWTKLPKKTIWCAIDAITKPLGNEQLEQIKLSIDEIVQCRVTKAVDKALDDVTPKYNLIIEEADKKYKPRYSEKPPDGSKAQNLLGGEMRICAAWVPDCPTNQMSE